MVKFDKRWIIEKMIRLADEGDFDAMLEAANAILFGDMTAPVDPGLLDLAVSCLRKAVEAGHTGAMISYGALFYNGRGVRQDFDEAIRWYKEAADRGNAQAVSYMGYMYYYGRGSLETDMEKAYQYFSKAALLGVPNAYYKCGDMFRYGQYVDQDPAAAFQLYMTCFRMVSADQPIDCYPDVCSRIGACFHKGIGTEKDLFRAKSFLTEAVRLFRVRVKQGDLFTDEVLKKAVDEWIAVSCELLDQAGCITT